MCKRSLQEQCSSSNPCRGWLINDLVTGRDVFLLLVPLSHPWPFGCVSESPKGCCLFSLWLRVPKRGESWRPKWCGRSSHSGSVPGGGCSTRSVTKPSAIFSATPHNSSGLFFCCGSPAMLFSHSVGEHLVSLIFSSSSVQRNQSLCI